MLEPKAVREEALIQLDGGSFPASGDHLETLRVLASVQDPVSDCLPLHFCCPPRGEEPDGVRMESLGHDRVLALSVAGKLLYAQIRWLDAVLDGAEDPAHGTVHQVNEALADLIIQHLIAKASADPTESLRVLSKLYARYSASAALDATYSDSVGAQLNFDDYVAQARARAAPARVPVDAALAELDVSPETRADATEAFELFTVGLQLYDDALDAEEDFRDRRPTWLVCATLQNLSAKSVADTTPDTFYEEALMGGFVSESLRAAEQYFKASYSVAESQFPRWSKFQRRYAKDVAKLRKQYEHIASA